MKRLKLCSRQSQIFEFCKGRSFWDRVELVALLRPLYLDRSGRNRVVKRMIEHGALVVLPGPVGLVRNDGFQVARTCKACKGPSVGALCDGCALIQKAKLSGLRLLRPS